MTRRDTVQRIIVANVPPGETLHLGPMSLAAPRTQRAFVVSAVVKLLCRAHTEKERLTYPQEGSGDHRDDPRYLVLVGPSTTRQRREWKIRREQVSGFLFRPISSCAAAPSDWQQTRRTGL